MRPVIGQRLIAVAIVAILAVSLDGLRRDVHRAQVRERVMDGLRLAVAAKPTVQAARERGAPDPCEGFAPRTDAGVMLACDRGAITARIDAGGALPDAIRLVIAPAEPRGGWICTGSGDVRYLPLPCRGSAPVARNG